MLLDDDALLASVGNSLMVAAAAMIVALLLGFPAALALDRASFPGKGAFRRLVLLPLILPGIITGLSLLMLFVTAGMKLSLLTIMLGHGTALISVATTEIFAGLQKLDRAQEEASLDLGASQWQTFWRVTVPNLRLSIIGAGLLIFTLSMDEIAVSFFLIGRDNTLPLEDLVATATWNYAGDQRHLRGDLRFLVADHRAVVPAAGEAEFRLCNRIVEASSNS